MSRNVVKKVLSHMLRMLDLSILLARQGRLEMVDLYHPFHLTTEILNGPVGGNEIPLRDWPDWEAAYEPVYRARLEELAAVCR